MYLLSVTSVRVCSASENSKKVMTINAVHFRDIEQ